MFTNMLNLLLFVNAPYFMLSVNNCRLYIFLLLFSFPEFFLVSPLLGIIAGLSTDQMPFPSPYQQCQNTEGNK